MNVSEKMPPNLKEILDDHAAGIFASLNCINVGKIESVNATEQTVEVSLQIKRLAQDGTSTAWPMLVDCPYFVLQGGGGYIDMPIAAGDYCLVLFNDRDIDTWWSTGNATDPRTPRKHSMSDGFALVGINPKTRVREKSPLGALRVINAPGVELNGNTKVLVTGAELQTVLTGTDGQINGNLSTIATVIGQLITAVTALGYVPPTYPTITPYTPVPVVTTTTPAHTTTVKTGG